MKATYIIAALVIVILVLLFWKRNGKSKNQLPPKAQLPLDKIPFTVEKANTIRNLFVNNDANETAATLAGIQLQSLVANQQQVNVPFSGSSTTSREVAVRTATGFEIVQSLN